MVNYQGNRSYKTCSKRHTKDGGAATKIHQWPQISKSNFGVCFQSLAQSHKKDGGMAKKIHQWPQHSTERIFTPPYSKWRNGAKGSTIAELIAARSHLDGGTAKKTPINKLNLYMTNVCPKSQKMMADWLKHLTH